MSGPVAVTDDTFNDTVVKSSVPVLVDFWATWCKPCTMIAPVLDELAREYSGKVKFTKVDVDANPKTAQQYHVMSIPTVLLFKNGQPVANMVGFRPKNEIKRNLDAALG